MHKLAERSEALVAAFNGAFWLWYQLTRDSDNPDRDADGTRFMDLIPEFQSNRPGLRPVFTPSFNSPRG
jgi:hypothetical protein